MTKIINDESLDDIMGTLAGDSMATFTLANGATVTYLTYFDEGVVTSELSDDRMVNANEKRLKIQHRLIQDLINNASIDLNQGVEVMVNGVQYTFDTNTYEMKKHGLSTIMLQEK